SGTGGALAPPAHPRIRSRYPHLVGAERLMFTGLVEEVGRIAELRPLENGRTLVIEADRVLEDLRPGDSIATDGVCLTATEIRADRFEVQAVATTLARTSLGSYEQGRAVNLERALALGDRLGGHLVQGHVDGVG